MSKFNEKNNENETDLKVLEEERKWKFVWRNVVFFSITHIISVYAIYLILTTAMWSTVIFAFVLSIISNVGATAGAHRLWTHKSYKAKLPLKILLLAMFTLSFEGSIHQWVRDHRMHHKHCDTDADPHNSTRGLFFSHIGWLLIRKHPEITRKGQTVDMSDITSDPLLRLQYKYHYFWALIISIIIPTYMPLMWGEELWTSICIAVILRHTYAAHMIFFINSLAHSCGMKPYDKNVSSGENYIISFLASGEAFHNYHHTFPWAYDLKTVSEEVIEKRAIRTGDGSHPVWGWGDKDLNEEHRNTTNILYKM